MKLHLSAVVFSTVALFAAACSSSDTGSGTGDLSSGHPVCDPLACPVHEHWSSVQCKCLPDCTEMWLCTTGDHWDADECKCVPNVVCDPLVCKTGEHWSSTLCECVPDAATN